VDAAYLPVWHGVHEAKLSGSAESAIESGENEPAGQAAHEGAAGTPENVPGAQTEHADWPGATEKVPTEHCEQKERLLESGWDGWTDIRQTWREAIKCTLMTRKQKTKRYFTEASTTLNLI
jgi:hypothetical protein